MQKNIASQKWRVFAFDRTTNAPLTGDAANITAKISKDFGTANATNDTNPTEVEDGYYEFDLTQAETNADDLLILPGSATANIIVVGCPARIATTPASWADGVIQTGDSFARIGTNGASLTQVGLAAASINAVADQVWDEAYSAHTSAGTFGKLMDILRKANPSVDGVVSGTPTTTTFDSDLTDSDGTWDHQLLIFTTGALAGYARPIDSFTQTNGVVVIQEALPVAPSSSDEFVILPQHIHPISEIQSGLATQASVDVIDGIVDDILVDTSTTLQAELDGIQADTEDIQSRLPAALVSGRIDAYVGVMAANVITSTAIQDDAITAAKIANAAIDAATFAADVDAEILSYIVDDATRIDASALNTATGTTIPAIVADTNELQTDWANGGRLDLIIDSRASQASVDDLPTNAELVTALGTADDATLAAIAALNNLSAGQVRTELATELGRIDAAVSSRMATYTQPTGFLAATFPLTVASPTNITAATGITVAAIGADVITAASLAADAVTEIQSGLASQTSVDVIDGIVDSILVDTAEIGVAGAGLTALASAANLATVAGYIDTEVAAIKAVTDAIGATGSGLSAIPWNAAWDAEVQSEVDDALVAQNLDHLVKSAVDTDFATTVHLNSVIGHLADNGTSATFDRTTDSLESARDNVGTAGAGLTSSDDAVLSAIAALNNISTAQVNAEVDTALADVGLTTTITGRIDVASSTLATAANLATANTALAKLDDTVEDNAGTYRFTTASLVNAPSDSGLDAAGVRAAVGLASANLDTQLGNIVADTNELQTDWANGGRLDLILDARASQTSVDDLPTNAELATSQAAADDATLAAIAALNNLSAAQVNAEVDTALADYDAPTNTEMVAAFTQIKGATWATTDTLEAIRDRGDTAWITSTGFATAAALATAQTSIDDLPTNAELATALGTADDVVLSAISTLSTAVGVIDDLLDTEVAAIKTKTDQLTFTVANQVDSNVLTGGLDAAATRAALGLASANLDTQLGDLPTNAELATALAAADDAVLAAIATVQSDTDNIQTRIPAALTADGNIKADTLRVGGTLQTAGDLAALINTVDDLLDTEVAAIKADTAAILIDTNELQADWTNGGRLDLLLDALPTAAANAAALMDLSNGIETSITPRQAIRLMLAAMAGKLSGAATTTVTIRNVGDSKDRITATVDSSGNRSAVTVDGT